MHRIKSTQTGFFVKSNSENCVTNPIVILCYGMCEDIIDNGGDFPVRLYASDISYDPSFFDRWYSLMPPERKERCNRFRHEQDRRRCITGYALLAGALRDLLDDPDIQGRWDFSMPLRISEKDNGKPFLENIPVCFNISHSGQMVIVSVSSSEVGCDVERVRADALAIARRFFTEEEYGYLKGLATQKECDLEFTRLWTMKESVVKCCGDGIRRSFNDFALLDKSGKRISKVMLADSDEVYHVKEYEGANGYCYSVCSLCADMEDTIRYLQLDQEI